jgi:hypothetical protein
MLKVSNLFLAQTLTSMADLKSAIGKGLGVLLIFVFLYAVIAIWHALHQERASGEWKHGIIKAIGYFAAVLIVNILFQVFFPGQGPIQVTF